MKRARALRRRYGHAAKPRMWKAVYRSGARRTVRADDYSDAMRKLTLPSGMRPESLVLVTEDEKDRKAAIAAWRAR